MLDYVVIRKTARKIPSLSCNVTAYVTWILSPCPKRNVPNKDELQSFCHRHDSPPAVRPPEVYGIHVIGSRKRLYEVIGEGATRLEQLAF